MVGNKTDMRHLRAVPTEQGKQFAEDKSIFFIESSAVESVNVDTAFVRLIEEITNTVIPKIINEAANSPDSGVWPYMPSSQMRTKDVAGQYRRSDERSKNRANLCCK